MTEARIRKTVRQWLAEHIKKECLQGEALKHMWDQFETDEFRIANNELRRIIKELR